MEVLACPHCNRLFQVTPVVLGKKIRCRGCAGIFHVPRDTTSVPLGREVEGAEDAAAPAVAIACVVEGHDARSCPACGRTFRMKDTFAGKRIRCRGCKESFRVTATVTPAREAVPDQKPATSTDPDPPPPLRAPPRCPQPVAVARPTVFEDIGDVLADIMPGERVASVVRPRNVTRLSRAEDPGVVTLIAVVFGGACALPIVQFILWWALRRDPLGVARSLPDWLRWIAPERL